MSREPCNEIRNGSSGEQSDATIRARLICQPATPARRSRPRPPETIAKPARLARIGRRARKIACEDHVRSRRRNAIDKVVIKFTRKGFNEKLVIPRWITVLERD